MTRGSSGNRREADIEGTAQIGNLVYWITSPGRRKTGERQDRRLRFFAARVSATGIRWWGSGRRIAGC